MSTDNPDTTDRQDMQPGTQLSVASAGATNAVAAVGMLLADVGAPAVHNFTGEPLEVWRKTAKARGGDCLSIDDLAGEPFELSHWYAHPVQLPGDQPGEIIDTVRVVLFDPAGQAVAFASQGVAQSLATLIHIIGPGPYEPPIKIKIEASRTRKGFKVFNIVPA